MTKKSDAPAIRFKGFSDAWEQRKLSEMCGTFEYGLNAAAKEFDGKNKYIRITDIDDVSREFLLSDLSSPDICLDGMSKYLLSSGDVVFARTGASVGKTYIYRENDGIVYFAGFLIRAKVNQDNDAEFVFQSTLSPSYEKYIRITSQRSGQPGVNAQEYSEYDLFAPSKEEQQRIGHFLRGIDHLITLHQRQPFLQSPPDISLIVQLTLPFYTFSWEQRKLASLCEKFTDGDWIESKDQSDFGVRLVQTGNVGVAEYLDKPNNKKWISEDTFDRLHCEEVLPGDILISRLPEPAGRACIVPLLGTKMITAVDCTIVRTAPDMSDKFLVQYLSSQAYFDDVNTCLAGGTRQRISRGNLANFDVPIPVKKSEQDAIGMFFGYLDNLITLHQRQTIVYAVIRSIRKVILAERQYFAPPMVRKSP